MTKRAYGRKGIRRFATERERDAFGRELKRQGYWILKQNIANDRMTRVIAYAVSWSRETDSKTATADGHYNLNGRHITVYEESR